MRYYINNVEDLQKQTMIDAIIGLDQTRGGHAVRRIDDALKMALTEDTVEQDEPEAEEATATDIEDGSNESEETVDSGEEGNEDELQADISAESDLEDDDEADFDDMLDAAVVEETNDEVIDLDYVDYDDSPLFSVAADRIDMEIGVDENEIIFAPTEREGAEDDIEVGILDEMDSVLSALLDDVKEFRSNSQALSVGAEETKEAIFVSSVPVVLSPENEEANVATVSGTKDELSTPPITTSQVQTANVLRQSGVESSSKPKKRKRKVLHVDRITKVSSSKGVSVSKPQSLLQSKTARRLLLGVGTLLLAQYIVLKYRL
jgi:hypothetical protein